jgi:hypothetical protein
MPLRLLGKTMEFNTTGMLKKNSLDGIPLKETISGPEPAPFKYDGLDYMREGVGEELNLTLAPLARPFIATGHNIAAAYNRSLGTLFEHLDCMAEFVGDVTGTEKGGLFETLANMYNNNVTYWQNQAQKKNSGFLDEMVGEAIGGAPFGVAEFMAGVPYAGFLGAAEAHKNDKSVVIGALTEAGKRGVLGGIFKMMSPLKQYLRAPAMGTVFGVQSAGEGAEPREIAKGFGTGFLYSMTSPGGQMGLNEVRSNLRTQIGLKAHKTIPATDRIKNLEADTTAESAHQVRNNIQKLAWEVRKLKKTDPAGYKKGMAELGKMEKTFNSVMEFGKWMEEHGRHLNPKEMKMEKAAAKDPGVVGLVRDRRCNLNLANYETNLFTNELEQTLTKSEREAIPFIIEKTGVSPKLGRLDLEDIVNKGKGLERVAENVQAHFDKSWAKIVEASPEMSVKEIENYVTHIWDIPKNRKQEITSWFVTENRFLKKRHIDNLNAGIEKGLIPKTLDIADIIRIHDSVTNRVIENNKFVSELKQLKKDGMPMMLRADKAPADWVYYDHPALKERLVIPKELIKGEEISPKLIGILEEIGISMGRNLDPRGTYDGVYFPGKQLIRIKEKASGRILAHEVGHHLDHALGLTERNFLNTFKDELFEINRIRIERYKETTTEAYARSSEEQIAEFFGELFTKPTQTAKVAPGATNFILDVMSTDGKLSRLVDFDFEKSAKQLIKEQMLTVHKLGVKVHPDLKKPLDVVFETTMQHGAIRGYEMVSGLLKKTWLSLSLFHHLALSETGVAMMGLMKTGKVLLNPVKLYKALAKNELDVFAKSDLAKDFIKHTGQVGATVDIPVAMIQQKLNDFAFKTKDIALINRATQFTASFNKQWDKALWSYLHDSLKIYAYESLVTKLNPKLDTRKQKIEMAQLVNDTFGGQNWETLMINPRTLQVARWMLLSPDWTYSTIRQALAPTGVGAIYRETKGVRQKAGAMFWMKAALYYGVGINTLNAAFRAYDEKQHPEFYPESPGSFMWDNTIGHKTHLFLGRWEDGSERYLRWGKQFRELPELFWDSTGGFSPVSASLKKLGGKMAPGIQVGSQVFTGHSLSGFRNPDIAGKQGWERVAGIAKTLMKTPFPFCSRNLMDANKEFHLTDLAMPSSKGFSRYKAIEYFKTAIYKKDEVLLREIYQEVLRNNLPAHTLFHSALIMVKAESTREYNRSLSTIQDVNNKLAIETDPAAVKRLNNLRRRMTKENTDRVLGLHLLDKSIVELNEHDRTSNNN